MNFLILSLALSAAPAQAASPEQTAKALSTVAAHISTAAALYTIDSVQSQIWNNLSVLEPGFILDTDPDQERAKIHLATASAAALNYILAQMWELAPGQEMEAPPQTKQVRFLQTDHEPEGEPGLEDGLGELNVQLDLDVRKIPALFESIIATYFDPAAYWPSQTVDEKNRYQHLTGWQAMNVMLLVANATQEEIGRRLATGSFEVPADILEQILDPSGLSLVDGLKAKGLLDEAAYPLVRVERSPFALPAFMAAWKAKIDAAYGVKNPGPKT